MLVDSSNMRSPLFIQSDFIHSSAHPPSPPELIDLTGFSDATRQEFGLLPPEGLRGLIHLMKLADYVVAHNGNEFDKIVMQTECERYGLDMPDTPWIDTKTDIEYPKHIKTTKLTYLCAEHEIPHAGAHRAIFDTQAMMRILALYDLDKVIELSKQPTVKVIAQVSYDDRQLAKDRGYHWNPQDKIWAKSMKLEAARLEKEQAGFKVRIDNGSL